LHVCDPQEPPQRPRSAGAAQVRPPAAPPRRVPRGALIMGASRLETRRTGHRKPNPLHARRIDAVDWKDVALLRTFISDRGKIRARRVTGLTPRQQRQVALAIRTAREMA